MNLRALKLSLLAPHRTARSRGHGIHSPFAFRFVGEVLQQPCAYYIYDDLDRAAAESGISPRLVRAIYRTALFFSPTPIVVLGPAGKAVEMALKTGNPHVPNPKESPRCVIGIGNRIAEVKHFWRESDCGMLFSTPEAAFFVKSKLLPHQRFDIFLLR